MTHDDKMTQALHDGCFGGRMPFRIDVTLYGPMFKGLSVVTYYAETREAAEARVRRMERSSRFVSATIAEA